MKKSTRNILIAGGALAAFTGTAVWLTAEGLASAALDRKPLKPVKLLEKPISGSAVNPSSMEAIKASGAVLEKKEHQVVNVRTSDGLTLAAHWFPVPDHERIIIAVHGWHATWNKDFGLYREFWEKNRCSVLLVEQRATGLSEGSCFCFGLRERYDVEEWVSWVYQNDTSGAPIYLHGVSMGATSVMMAAGTGFPGRVKGIIADCGFISPEAIWSHVLNKNLHLPYNKLKVPVNHLFRRRVGMNLDAYSTIRALERNKIPVLFIHGGSDGFVPVEMTYANYEATMGERDIVIVAGADHGMSYYVDPKKCEAKISEFWAAHDNDSGERKTREDQ